MKETALVAADEHKIHFHSLSTSFDLFETLYASRHIMFTQCLTSYIYNLTYKMPNNEYYTVNYMQ